MTTNQEIYEKIYTILTKTFKIDGALIKEDSDLQDGLNLDSVELMDAICVLEEEFKVKIIEKGEKNTQIPITITDLINLISEKIKKSRPNYSRPVS
jgi:acyl carrier protein